MTEHAKLLPADCLTKYEIGKAVSSKRSLVFSAFIADEFAGEIQL